MGRTRGRRNTSRPRLPQRPRRHSGGRPPLDGYNVPPSAFANISAAVYIRTMVTKETGTAFFARAAVAALVVGGLTGAAFAGWVENGSAMLMSLAASGLAWCF